MFSRALRVLLPLVLVSIPAASPPAWAQIFVAQNGDFRDTSQPRIRSLIGKVFWSDSTWSESQQKVVGMPLSIHFNGPAAPVSLLGKTAPAESILITPAVPGTWRWVNSQQLAFEPQGGWIAPRRYSISVDSSVYAPDCRVQLNQDDDQSTAAPSLTCSSQGQSFYIDPKTPLMQKAVATILFNHPVALEEVRRHLKVVNVSTTPLFSDRGSPQVIRDERNPLRFFLYSPLVKLGEKEDLVRFEITPGLSAIAGGNPLRQAFEAKVTVPSRYSGFHFTNARPQIVPTAKDEPRQFLFLESSLKAEGSQIAKHVEAWQLPAPAKDKSGEEIPWTAENVTAAILAKSQRVPLEYIANEGSAPQTDVFAFRLQPREPGPLFVRVPKDTAAPGGFVTPEDFTAFVSVPPFEKEAKVVGRGGILALTGERKLNIKSRGYEHLRYTLARVPGNQINHFVSQTQGKFEAPQFQGNFGFEDIAHFSQSTQNIAKANDFEANFSTFDFNPALEAAEPSGKDAQRGLFYMVVQGVRPRTEADGPAPAGDPDPKWIAMAAPPQNRAEEPRYSRRHRDEDDDEAPETLQTKAADSRFVLLTDLGLILKCNADGSRDVFVQSFQAGQPVADVRLTALGRNGEAILEVVTDAQGRALIPSLEGMQREKQPVALIARKASDLAFIAWARGDRRVETSRFDVDGVQSSRGTALNAFVFTERGIYRPGDSIQVAAIVRQRNWEGTLTGLPLEVVLTNAKEEEAGRFPVKLTPEGFITLTLPTTETSPTGVWRIELRRPSKKKTSEGDEGTDSEPFLGQTLVRVEEFQPDRLKLSAKFSSDAIQAWVSPENLSVQLDLQTLFGIAAADRRVTGKLRLTPASPNFEQWPGWTFSLPAAQKFETQEIELAERKTDDNGLAIFELPLEDHTSPLLRATVELEGFEADAGRGVHTAVSTLVSRQPFLLGYKPEGDLNFLRQGFPLSIDITAIGADAKTVAASGLKRVLIETRHASVLSKQQNGTMAYVSQRVDKDIETVDGSLRAGTTTLALPVHTAGSFRYEWRDVMGIAQLTVAFTVVGAGESSRSLERESELHLSLPSKVWKPGEELEISLRAPFTGAGLITIEREKVLVARWFKAEESASIQHITVPEGIEGGAYVHVTFVRGLDSPEVFTNPLSTGVAPFRVAQDRRQLTVQLDAPERVRPGERVAIGFSTPKPARIVVWAVDEGIHRVTSYQPPTPLKRLLNKPSLEVNTYQLLDLLIPEFTLLKNAVATGGDEDALEPPELKLGLNPFKRRRVAPVVFWSGIVECGPERKEVFYQVPDYFAGRLNIMAAAVAPDAVGVAEQHTLVKGPFVLTPNAPFFSAPNDEFTASVTVANQLEGAAVTDQIEVRAVLQGGLEFVEKPEEKVVVAVGKETTVRYRLRTTEALGNAEIKFSASANQQQVDQTATISVRPGTPRTAVVQSGWFRSESRDVKVEHDFYREFSKREAVVSTTPLGLARGLATYLRNYPFGCSEQITSSAFPWLVLREDASFGLDKTDAAKAIHSAIAQLSRRQGPKGGFGYWASANDEDFDYLSVYVTHFLTEAKAAGFHVPAPMFDAALRRLRLMADAKVTPPYPVSNVLRYDVTRHQANMQAAAIYLLTRNEEMTTNYALKLTDFLNTSVPAELWQRDASAAWLAATWRLLKKEDEARRLIEKHRQARAVPTVQQKWSFYWESPLTEEATTFTILCRHFPEIAGKFGYEELKPITEMIENGFFHTLSASWSVQALKSYSALVKASGVRVGIAQVGQEFKMLVEPQAGMSSTTLQSGTARFLISQGAGSKLGAWYQTVETGFDHSLPSEPESRTLEVHREILGENGAEADAAKVGETLLIKVTVRNLGTTAQPHVALSELLPGAFDFAPESENHALKPGLGTLPGTNYVDVREDRALLFCGLAAGQTLTFTYAVRPTCAGTFSVPPAYAESMYDRAVHGRGVAKKFTVIARE